VNAARATLAFAAFLIGAPWAHAENPAPEDPRVYLTQYKCYFCHADREAKAGPAFADIAAQYRNDRDAVARLTVEIRRGIRSGGPWHMPPHPEVSRPKARAIARYVMSLAPPKAGG
jgi:cytochrome c551/c552